MRVSKKWQDYCLIDTADGERLERWGDVRLVDVREAQKGAPEQMRIGSIQ